MNLNLCASVVFGAVSMGIALKAVDGMSYLGTGLTTIAQNKFGDIGGTMFSSKWLLAAMLASNVMRRFRESDEFAISLVGRSFNGLFDHVVAGLLTCAGCKLVESYT